MQTKERDRFFPVAKQAPSQCLIGCFGKYRPLIPGWWIFKVFPAVRIPKEEKKKKKDVNTKNWSWISLFMMGKNSFTYDRQHRVSCVPLTVLISARKETTALPWAELLQAAAGWVAGTDCQDTLTWCQGNGCVLLYLGDFYYAKSNSFHITYILNNS